MLEKRPATSLLTNFASGCEIISNVMGNETVSNSKPQIVTTIAKGLIPPMAVIVVIVMALIQIYLFSYLITFLSYIFLTAWLLSIRSLYLQNRSDTLDSSDTKLLFSITVVSMRKSEVIIICKNLSIKTDMCKKVDLTNQNKTTLFT
uniref:Uncharacterized protein n=1 Tax=Glossina palpalis gambiensis TaxID=67801 RepID=A0A1B0AV69_9MUSC